MSPRRKTRSPIKQTPLRYAGQSIDDEIYRLISEKVDILIMLSACFILLAFATWVYALSERPPNAVIMTIIAVVFTSYSAVRIRQTMRKVQALKLGRDGEREVGEQLDALRERGYAIFHDIVGDDFNIDHVVLCSRGVFVVETKTRSKPVGRGARVVYDGDKVLVDGRKPDRDPIKQAEANAKWLRNILKESTGKEYPVRAAVVFPGWWVERTASGKRKPIWVINPEGLPAFIEHEPTCIPDEDVHLAAYHLARYIRAPR
jgi:hypothetical protein